MEDPSRTLLSRCREHPAPRRAIAARLTERAIVKKLTQSFRGESSAKHGVALSVTAGLLNIVVNIALFPLILHTVGAAQYGIWLFLIALSQYFFYSDLGIGSAIVYYASTSRGGQTKFSMNQLISNGVGWASAISVVAMPLYLFAAYQYAHTHGAASGLTSAETRGLVIAGGVLIASIIIRPFESVLIGTGHLALHIAYQIAGNAVRTIAVITLCLTGASVTAIAAAEVAGLCLGPILATIYVNRKRLARVRLGDMSVANVKGLFHYSLKSFAVDVVTVGVLSAGTVMVGLIKGPASAAYFALAMKVFNGAGQVLTWTTAPALPVFSRIWHVDPVAAKRLVQDMLTIVATAACVFIVPIALSSVVWMPYWIPEEGTAIEACIVIVLVGLLSSAIFDPVLMACSSFGRPGAMLPTQLVTAATFALMGIPLTYRYGIVGTAIALATAMWIVAPYCLLILSRTLDLSLGRDIAACYRLPAITLLAGGALAIAGQLMADELALNAGWFTTAGFLTGAAVALLLTSIGRNALSGSRRLLDLPM